MTEVATGNVFTVTASAVHPAGVLLDENGHPVLDENGEPVYVQDGAR